MTEGAPSPLPFRGRSLELGIADGHLQRALGGERTVLIVEGADGSGVSRLLQAVCERAAGFGMAVRTATATPAGHLPPLGLLTTAVAQNAAPTLRMRPVDEAAQNRLLEAIEGQLRQLSLAQRVLICLDDLQLSDSITLAGLRRLATSLQDRPIAWLLAAGGSERPYALQTTWTALEPLGVQRLVLRPLESVAIGQIAEDLLGRPPGPELTQLIGGTARSPGLLVALLVGLEKEGLLRVGDHQVDLLRYDIPARVRELVRDRLEPLSPRARDIARAAAILGCACTFDRLSAMLELGAGALLQPLDELVRRGLLSETDDGVVFTEELVGEAVVAMLSTPVRRAVERQAADVLFAEKSRTLELAAQLAISVDAVHSDAGTAMLAATRSLAPAHPRVAAEIGGHALQLVSDDDPTYATLATETAVSLHAAGEHERGAALAAAALRESDSADAEGALWLQLSLSFALPALARTDAARRALARPGLSAALAARLRASLVVSLAACGELDQALDVAREVIEDEREARHASERFGPVAARRAHALAVAAHIQDRCETALAHLGIAESRAEGHRDPDFDVVRDLTRSEAVSLSHGPDAALRISTARCAWALRERRSVASRVWLGVRGRQLLQAGRLEEAVEALRPRSLKDDGGPPHTIWDAAALVAFARAATHLGLSEDVALAQARAHVAVEDPLPEIRRHAQWLLAMTGDESSPPGLELPRCPVDMGDPARFVRIYRTLDPEGSRRAVAAAQNRREQNRNSILLAAAADHATGLLHDDTRLLLHASELFEVHGRPIDAATALDDLAAMLRATGAAPAEQVVALETACRAWEQLGAVADEARGRAALVALGAYAGSVPV